MPFDQADAITEEQVRNRLEEIVQESLGFRDAFRERDVPDDVGSTWKIPQPDDTIGQPDKLQPGASYPSTEEDYSKISIDRQKHGFEMAFLDEAVMDNTGFDPIADQVDRAGRQMAEHFNGEAYTELTNNLNTNSPTQNNQNGTLTRDDYLAGLSTLEGSGYNPDLMIVEENGLTDLRTDGDFIRSTEFSDEIVQTGMIGTADGMDVVIDQTNNLSDNDAYLVDTDFYGYEAIWSGVEVTEYRDEDTDTEYRKARSYRQWKAMDSGAAIKINA